MKPGSLRAPAGRHRRQVVGIFEIEFLHRHMCRLLIRRLLLYTSDVSHHTVDTVLHKLATPRAVVRERIQVQVQSGTPYDNNAHVHCKHG